MTKQGEASAESLASSIRGELKRAGSRAAIFAEEERYRAFMEQQFPGGDPRALKHGYAVRLSGALARTIADALRPDFPGILPDAHGKGGESAAPVHAGYKKLDINYSTIQLGLALGISIKTLNFHDEGSGRYTKNATRVDNELRAEADDYHRRQPYCVMIALVFVPSATTRDPGTKNRTSFRHIYETLSKRSGRLDHNGPTDKFERIFLAVYQENETSLNYGQVTYCEVLNRDDSTNEPVNGLTLADVLASITETYYRRNPQQRRRR